MWRKNFFVGLSIRVVCVLGFVLVTVVVLSCVWCVFDVCLNVV